MTILVLALARPQSVVGVPRFEGTVVLAFDVSGSMAADDIAPTRMEAAKAAASTSSSASRRRSGSGVVAFSDSGFSTQVPTDDQAAVLAAIERLEPERGTSLGRGHPRVADRDRRRRRATRPTDYYTNRSPDPTPRPDARPGRARTSRRSSCC